MLHVAAEEIVGDGTPDVVSPGFGCSNRDRADLSRHAKVAAGAMLPFKGANCVYAFAWLCVTVARLRFPLHSKMCKITSLRSLLARDPQGQHRAPHLHSLLDADTACRGTLASPSARGMWTALNEKSALSLSLSLSFSLSPSPPPPADTLQSLQLSLVPQFLPGRIIRQKFGDGNLARCKKQISLR